LLDRFVQWVGDRINQLLRLLFGAGAGAPARPGSSTCLAREFSLRLHSSFFRSARGGLPKALSRRNPWVSRAADYFAEADRLAARGERLGAIRALCAGVAATLSGERTWEGSPLTVREIFQKAPDPAACGPLLMPFEAAVYGGREVDAATYDQAARVAGALPPACERGP